LSRLITVKGSILSPEENKDMKRFGLIREFAIISFWVMETVPVNSDRISARQIRPQARNGAGNVVR